MSVFTFMFMSAYVCRPFPSLLLDIDHLSHIFGNKKVRTFLNERATLIAFCLNLQINILF